MFPMVSTVAELVEVRAMLDEAVAASGRARPDGLQVGIMVEVPAAALKAAAFVDARRLLQHRHQRPHPVRPGRRARQRRRSPRSPTRSTPASCG